MLDPVTLFERAATMDQLVHTRDLAVAIGGDRDLDPELVGPKVSVFAGATAQDRLLGAMGRQP